MAADPDEPLFPARDPYDSGHLPVAAGHRLYFEQSGNPHGIAAVVVHGGPGSGSSPLHRRFFDPARYRVVLTDQRGSGRSEPRGETRHNHTAALIGDLESLRCHLGIERWLVVGGSWGAALGAAYAATHRSAVSGLLLRGLFLTGRNDLDWFFGGAAALRPEAWEAFLATVPRHRRRHLQSWLWQVFAGADRPRQEKLALAWLAWERSLCGLPPVAPPAGEPLDQLVDRYRVQAHFLARRCDLGEAAVLEHLSRLQGLPVLLLHGRQDLVCRPVNAWRAHRRLAGSRLEWVEGAGHDPFSPAMAGAMVDATTRFAARGGFAPASG